MSKINSELLKEAIADAKAVRATALANAKASLEEAFAPRFEAMFADKLKEESEEEMEQETVTEVEAAHNVAASGGQANPGKTKAVSKGQPTKRSDGNTQYKPVKAGKGPSDVGNPTKKVNETAVEETEAVEETFEQQEEAEKVDESSVEEAGLTSEDLDEIIRELEAEVAGDAEGEKPEPQIPGAEVNAEPGAEVNIDANPEDAGGCPPSPCSQEPAVAGGEDQGGGPGGEVPDIGGGEGEADGVPSGEPEAVPQPDDAFGGAKSVKSGEDEDINLEELLAALNEDSYEEADKEMDEVETIDEIKNNGMPAPTDGQAKDKAKMTSAKTGNKNQVGKSIENTPSMKETTEVEQLREAVKQYESAIEFLRGQINEVNLLNAKLLYTNKLFKEFATVIDDPYRMKIVEAFDLTKTVRETKLVYTTLAESLNNFGKQMVSRAKVQTKPVLQQKGSVKQITEGLASKPVASTKPSREILSEGVDMASRFKKLAGIKDAVKK